MKWVKAGERCGREVKVTLKEKQLYLFSPPPPPAPPTSHSRFPIPFPPTPPYPHPPHSGCLSFPHLICFLHLLFPILHRYVYIYIFHSTPLPPPPFLSSYLLQFHRFSLSLPPPNFQSSHPYFTPTCLCFLSLFFRFYLYFYFLSSMSLPSYFHIFFHFTHCCFVVVFPLCAYL